MSKIYYKVVYGMNGKLYSAWLRKMGMEYKVGEVTKRKSHCGPLAVFSNLQDATLFMRRWSSGSIYTCTIKPSTTTGLWYRKGIYTKTKKRAYYPTNLGGTVYAEEVTLLERVK